MNNDNRVNSSNHNSSNHFDNNSGKRRSQYNKNYRGTRKNYTSNYKNKAGNFKNNRRYDDRNKEKNEDRDFSVTKQQVFDFDEMKFSDEIDTSFVDGRRKKKEKIVDELVESYEKGKRQEKKRESRSHLRFQRGRVVFVVAMLLLLLSLLGVGIYILLRPVPTKVVTKEKEVVVLDDNYLFLGDSITELYDLDEYFPDMNVVNSGVSGNKTQDILKDLKNRAYRYNPSKVFLLIGTNDIQAGVDSDEIIQNIEEILVGLKKNRPYAQLYLESIYPVNEDKSGAQDRTNKEIQAINQALKKYCKEEDITFINLYDLLLNEDGQLASEYTKDGLHLSEQGYEVVTKEIMKYLD